ncbi:hypothetical protein HMPREF0765_1798 [Sphingobacterium spiritivorum ATCC 33300]|uniref:Susd and RagB outer membrane lipoprotein n=1 Tax=Sphingobacterium spiritivorum ATCC 33300 TaxID=525372 RepID=C2FWU2_SPHSI|nr:SusD/RagB family nutrient-binding outer membrane lipoprotein [Sphingobacterium spiritivorum]EEI92571.1 hypothetical protein HMPREF0765_1798 [Sphingobacterium spiritivorum ATCC 33300]QQS94102.1 SusD/RagB family nutrient-binding outer membrane lipoprotein [Sphingobacterium spiritivorum]
MKKLTFQYIYSVGIVASMIFAISCTKNFESLNTHPTNPTEQDLTNSEKLGTLFPSLIATMHYAQENKSQHIEQMVGGQYGGYFATTNNWQGTNFGTFNPALDWVEVPFKDIMVDFNSNFIKIKRVTESKGYIYAWASIIRVAAMLRVTDMYGPIPYSKIGESNDDNVAFDDVKTIYHLMFDELNSSINTLNNFIQESNNSKSHPMATYDIVYNGDFSKWIRFANSLKMRMAMRISSVDTDYAKGMFLQAMQAGAIETNADNAWIPTDDNPYYKASVNWGDLAISATLSSYMNGFGDPRRPKYMTLASFRSEYRGVRTGIQNINKTIYSNVTYFSKPAFSPNTPLLVFCAAEISFLKAEAALKGWISGGDALAKNFYETGIQTSMSQHAVATGAYLTGKKVPQAYTNPFIIGQTVTVANPITVNWDDVAGTQNSKLEKIITQKWLANFPYGMEAWADYRRTGFPQLFPAQNNLSSSNFIGSVINSSGRLVRRLPYPQAQYRSNGANVTQAISLLGGDDVASTDLWWAKKN